MTAFSVVAIVAPTVEWNAGSIAFVIIFGIGVVGSSTVIACQPQSSKSLSFKVSDPLLTSSVLVCSHPRQLPVLHSALLGCSVQRLLSLKWNNMPQLSSGCWKPCGISGSSRLLAPQPSQEEKRVWKWVNEWHICWFSTSYNLHVIVMSRLPSVDFAIESRQGLFVYEWTASFTLLFHIYMTLR